MDIQHYPLWTALITPFLENGEIDFTSLKKLIDQQINAKNGLLILGSTGEALNLNLNQRKKIIEFVLSQKPASPIMVGVGGNLLEEQMDWINYLNTLEVHAYLLVTPHYAKPGHHGQLHWFKTLLDTAKKPCMLYNVPGRTAVPLLPSVVMELSNHPHFWAIKEASGSVEKCKEFLKVCQGKMVFCGDDALMAEFAQAGCSGLVSVASNAWPDETHLYVRQCLLSTLKDKNVWEKASNSLFICSNPVPVKHLLFKRGDISSSKMAPPLSHLDMPSSEAVLDADSQIKTWFKKEV